MSLCDTALWTFLQSVAHTQHSPLPILHWPTDEVTVQGADTLVSKSPAAQLQVSPHTATVWSAAHTQHSPLPTVQLPVSDWTAHGADSLATSDAAPQLQVSPHTATVGSCATWTQTSGCSCPSSPPPAVLSYARLPRRSARTSRSSPTRPRRSAESKRSAHSCTTSASPARCANGASIRTASTSRNSCRTR